MRITLVAALLLTATPSAQAWVGGEGDTHHADLAEAAAARLPVEHRRLLEEHREAFRHGAGYPDVDIQTFWHTYEPQDGSGGAAYEAERALYDAVVAMRDGSDPQEAAFRLGYLTHFVLDLSVPFHTGTDAYDNPWHLDYERAAYAAHPERNVAPARAPQEVDDAWGALVALSWASANRSEALIRALDTSGHPYPPEAAAITDEMVALGLEATADLLLTAFLQAAPSRPDPQPTYEAHRPTLAEPQDLGFGITDMKRLATLDRALVLLAAFILLATGGVVATRLARRRGRPGR